MKITKTSESGYTLVELMIVCIILGIVLITPITLGISTTSRQKIINEQCGTDYSFVDVLLNSETIEKTCQIKEQTITIK